MSSAAVRRAALSLPSGERAELAAELLASLDEASAADLASEGEWDAAWGEELERRVQEVERGAATVPAADVFEAARRRRASRE